VTEDHLKAEILNDFFISVLVHEPEDLQLPTFRCDNIKSSLFDVHISEDEVRSKLLKLKPNKSSGPDNIHVYVLRNVPNLSIPLTKIFQLSMDEYWSSSSRLERCSCDTITQKRIANEV